MKNDLKILLDKLESLEREIKAAHDKPYNSVEAAKYLGVSPNYLYKLTSKNKIRFYKPNGKIIFFTEKDLKEWALRNESRPLTEVRHEN